MCWECCLTRPFVLEFRGLIWPYTVYSGTREQIRLYLLTSGCTWMTFIALIWANAKTLGLGLQFELVLHKKCTLRVLFSLFRDLGT